MENAWGGAPKNIGWVDRLSTTRKTESMKGSKRSRDRAACWPQMQFGVATEAETYYTLASPCGFYGAAIWPVEGFDIIIIIMTRESFYISGK